MIPVIIWLIGTDRIFWAFFIFGMAALTDLFDGLIARRRDQVTELGRVLDPLTDRLFISSIVVALYFRQDVAPPLWAILALVIRDLVILAGSGWFTIKKVPIEVTMLGKTATAVLLVSILLMVGKLEAGLWLLYAGLALYLVSGVNYIASGKKVWKSRSESI